MQIDLLRNIIKYGNLWFAYNPSLGYANIDNSFLYNHKYKMIRSIIYYVNFYFPEFKTELYPDNFIKACLVYQSLYIKYFSYDLDLNQIISRLSDYKHSCSSNSSILTNHLIFSLAFRQFWKHYKLGRGCVYVANTPFKESEVLGYLTGIIYWFFHNRVLQYLQS